MTARVFGRARHLVYWFLLPIGAVVVGVFLALPWLARQSAVLAQVVSVAAAILVMGYSMFITKKDQRGMDEVQIASQGFASSRGWVWGAMIAAVLLSLPPVLNWLADAAIAMSSGSQRNPNRTAVMLAFFGGFALVVLLQTLSVCVAATVWWRRMGEASKRS